MDVTAPDGRTLVVTEAGDPDGKPVLGQHGTPGSGEHVPRLLDELAREQGVRLIQYDRPGYGNSTRHEGRAVVDCVGDVHAIADALALDRFASWGISGGGPHVLACAARCDDRLVAVASLASIAPYGADGLDWLAGMGDENIREFAAVTAGAEELDPYLAREREEFLAADPDELVEVMRTLLGPEDLAVLTGEFARESVDSLHAGLAHGHAGWLDDDLAQCAPWGFDVAEVDRPVLLAHGRWLAERVPGVETRIGPGDGHLTMLAHRVRDAHEWLLAQL